MDNTKLENIILQTIDILTSNKIANAGYDKTVQVTVLSTVDATIGKYKVKYQDSVWFAYSNNTDVSYSNGTSVYVLVPGGDLSRDKTILGTTEKLGINYITLTQEINKYYPVGKNVILSGGQGDLNSYIDNDVIVLYDKTSNNNPISLDVNGIEEYLKNSDYFALKAKIKTALPTQQQYNGDYGILVTLDYANNVTKSYMINIDSILGNPYKLIDYTNQYEIFEIDKENFVGINQISIFSQNFSHQANNKPDDIFIHDLEIQGLNRIPDQNLDTCALVLNAPHGTIFASADASSRTIRLEAEVRVKGQIVNLQFQQLPFYWFVENTNITTNSDKYCKYGGQGWECLNDVNQLVVQGVTVYEIAPAANVLSITKSDVLTKKKKYKCVVLYDDVSFSREVTITNLGANYDITIVSNKGTEFYLDSENPVLTCKVYNGSGTDISNNSSLSFVWGKTDYKGMFSSISQGQNRNQLNVNVQEITNYITYKCSVFTNNGVDYIGTASIVLVHNGTAKEKTYSLIINNGVQVFKYNTLGISPASDVNKRPYNIPALTFTLFDPQGNEVSSQALALADITWSVPVDDTMLKVTDYTPDDYTQGDEKYIFKNLTELVYHIATSFNAAKGDNEIQLKVVYQGQTFIAKTNFVFIKEGAAGTNGTDYFCRVIPNTLDGVIPYYPSLTYNGSSLTYNWINTGNPSFKVELWHNGEIIFSGNLDGTQDTNTSEQGKEVKITWDILRNRYGRQSGSIIQDKSDLAYAGPGANGTFTLDSSSPLRGTTISNYTSYHPANIIKATIEYDGYTMYGYLPLITFRNFNNNNYNFKLKEYTGFNEVLYNEAGLLPAYDTHEPFTIENQLTATNFTCTWRRHGSIWERVNSAWTEKKETDQTSIWSKTLPTQVEYNQYKIQPIDLYDGQCVTVGISCQVKVSNTTVYWMHVPIHYLRNRYFNSALNAWDGNSVQLGQDGGMILAPQVGAGQKDDQNRFTGLFMGTAKDPGVDLSADKIIGGTNYDVGLFGYHEGDRTIFLDAKTGKAEFGKSGAGQIILDPTNNTAQIKSGNYNYSTTNGSGMLIDLTTPEIKFGNGNFEVDQNGNVTAKSGTISANTLQTGILQSDNSNDPNFRLNLDTGQLQIKQLSIIANDYVTSNDLSTAVSNAVDDIQDQIDGNIETYSASAVPTLSNYPASGWTTNTEKDKHIGDLYIVNSAGGDYAGYYYRFEYDSANSRYQWVLIKDTQITKALSDAAQAISDVTDLENLIITDYSTTSEMNSAITQSAQQIQSTVSNTYATKTQAQGWADDAQAAANNYTDGQLVSYSTTQEMNSAITQKANEINQSVSSTYATITTVNDLDAGVITSDILYYLATNASTGVTRNTAGWTTSVQNVTASKKYLWIYHKYTKGTGVTSAQQTELYTDPVIYGVYGQTGANGAQSATVQLFKKFTTTPSTTDRPTQSVIYTFSTRSINLADGNAGLNGWTTSVPTENGICYTILATAYSTEATDTITTTQWSAPIQFTGSTGADGTNGYSKATVILYQRAASQPSKPTASVTYTFSTDTLSSVPSGWSRTLSTGSNPCWSTSITFYSQSATATSSGWTDVIKLVENGINGTNGASIEWDVPIYYLSNNGNSAPTAPSVTVTQTSATKRTTWTKAIPKFDILNYPTYIYLWTCHQIKYSNSNTPTCTSVVLDNSLVDLNLRMSSAEQKITDEAIVNTVKSATAFGSNGNLTINGALSQIEQKADSIKSEVEGSIAVINLIPQIYLRENEGGNPYVQINNEVIWTVNIDGSITATPGEVAMTANREYTLAGGENDSIPWIIIDPNKSYTLSGVPSTNCAIVATFYKANKTSSTVKILNSGTESITLTQPASDGYKYVSVKLRVNQTTIPSAGYTFYPQLQVGGIAHSYLSTHGSAIKSSIEQTAREIRSQVSETYIAATSSIPNLLPQLYNSERAVEGSKIVTKKTRTYSGMTFEVLDDGSIKISGTSTAVVSYNLTGSTTTSPVEVPCLNINSSKDYYLSGCPIGGGESSYTLRARFTPSGTTPGSDTGVLYSDYGQGRLVPYKNSNNVNNNYAYAYLYIRIASGYTTPAEGIIFKPMLIANDSPRAYNSSHSLTSSITQNANNIELKVSESDVTGNYIIGKINLNSTTATIAAQHINLQGAVNINSLGSDVQAQFGVGSNMQQLWYAKANTTPPSKPTSQITSTATTGGGWRTVIPVWDSNYPHYFYCFQYQQNSTYKWTSVMYDASVGQSLSKANSASTAASNAQTTANNALKSTVAIYYRSTTHSVPTKPTSSTIVYPDVNVSPSVVKDDEDNVWTRNMPKPKRGRYFYQCYRSLSQTDEVSYTTPRQMSNTSYTSLWAHTSDSTYIDGGRIYANSITAAQIAANTITANEIATNTITAAQIATNTITANEIAANTITSNEIAANTITAAQIAANTITGNEIAAGSISTKQLRVADMTELVTVNPYDSSTYNTSSSFGVVYGGKSNPTNIDNGDARDAKDHVYVKKIDPDNQFIALTARRFNKSFKVGDKIHIEVLVFNADSVERNAYIQLRSYPDATSSTGSYNINSNSLAVPANTWKWLKRTIVIAPEDEAIVGNQYWYIFVSGAVGSSDPHAQWWFTRMSAALEIDGVTIKDGTITANKLVANSITTNQLAASVKQAMLTETIQLWYAKANTTAPSKPTAEIAATNASTTTYDAWTSTIPTYSSSYPYYYYCYQYKFADGSFDWSGVKQDRAVNNANATAASAASAASAAQTIANAALEKTQIIYKKAASGTTSMTAPTSWITSASATNSAWGNVRPEYDSSYPVLFTAIQSQTKGGTVSCTTPVIDKTTTVIDGGNIITNSITAEKISVTDLQALGATIAGWEISSNQLYKETDAFTDTDGNSYVYKPFLNAPTRIYEDSIAFSVRQDTTPSGSSTATTTYPFRVNYNGDLYATKAHIKGDSQIAGWIVEDTRIKKERTISGTLYRACLYSPASPTTSNGAFYIGTSTDNGTTWEYPFRVTYGGAMTSTSGTIGGWSINSNTLYKTTGNYSVKLSAPSSPNTANRAIEVLYNNNNSFYVTYGGKLHAEDVDISGAITATSLTLSGTATIPAAKISGTITAGAVAAGAVNANSLSIGGQTYSSWLDAFNGVTGLANGTTGELALGNWTVRGIGNNCIIFRDTNYSGDARSVRIYTQPRNWTLYADQTVTMPIWMVFSGSKGTYGISASPSNTATGNTIRLIRLTGDANSWTD